MNQGIQHRRPYFAPQLSIYGTFADLTLTAAVSKNMSDNLGMGTLKT